MSVGDISILVSSPYPPPEGAVLIQDADLAALIAGATDPIAEGDLVAVVTVTQPARPPFAVRLETPRLGKYGP